MTKFSLATSILLLLSLAPSDGFTVRNDVCNKLHFTSRKALPTPEESAKALSDYMAKSHEQKLKAVKEVEEKKNAEIQMLKKEMEELKNQNGSSAPIVHVSSTPSEGSVEDLEAKLEAYQKFMTDYIVRAQEDKLKAVRAAELAMALKFEEKLKLLPGNAEPAPQEVTTAPAGVNTVFAARNEKVAKAGKSSRWGNMEVEKITTGKASSPPPTSVASPVSTQTVNEKKSIYDASTTPPEVIAADHGLRADGGVGGLTLAERVMLGTGANGVSKPSGEPTIFEKRNARVAAAGKSGKSRWGVMETNKATEFINVLPPRSNSVPESPPKPEVVAADHGLRADGGVGGPSLSDRVNLGAKLLHS